MSTGDVGAVRRSGAAAAAGRSPLVELLYFDGCSSHERLLPIVERLAAQAGADLRVRAVETLEAAETERFLGSPSLRVDGEDVEPAAAARTDFGLGCRIYRSEHGQPGVPPEEWIHAALTRANAASPPHPFAPRPR